MSNEYVYVASLNRLENRIDSDQAELDRRYGLLREEINKLKAPRSALDQINNGLALLVAQDNRRVLGDLPSRIGDILSTITSRLHSNDHTTTSTRDLDSSEGGDKDTAETANLGGNELGTETQNESPTSEQSNTRKRRRAGKSPATECSSLENSLPSAEVSTPGSMTMSKRARVSSTLNRRESAEQVNTQSGVDSSDEDDQIGGEIDSSGEEGVEQSETEEIWWESETELGDEEKGHYKIEILKLKCIEDGCNAEVASRDELHRHLRNDHLTSSPYRCLAEGCFEPFEQWNGRGLAIHVRNNHSNISTWQCPHCTKTFMSHNRLYNHLHFYHFEGQFKCGYDGCHYDRVATLRAEIKSHQRTVHPKSTIYTCQFDNCDKSFKRKGDFNRHQQIHSGVKPFRCGWTGCVKSFTRKFSLINHQRIHQKVKPYKCTWNRCDYASTQHSTVITKAHIPFSEGRSLMFAH